MLHLEGRLWKQAALEMQSVCIVFCATRSSGLRLLLAATRLTSAIGTDRAPKRPGPDVDACVLSEVVASLKNVFVTTTNHSKHTHSKI